MRKRYDCMERVRLLHYQTLEEWGSQPCIYECAVPPFDIPIEHVHVGDCNCGRSHTRFINDSRQIVDEYGNPL